MSARAFDIARRGARLLVLHRAAAAALAVVAIRLESPGPPIYRQRRVGMDGQAVRRAQAAHDGRRRRAHGRRAWRSTRATRASRASARFLRRTSLDELPNLRQRAARRDGAHRPAPDAAGAGRAVHRAPARAAGGQARASPAGRRSTAARRCRGRSASSSTSGTSSTARWRSTCGSCGARAHVCSAAAGSTRARPAAGRASCDAAAVLLTGVGKRYDIVAASRSTRRVVAADPTPLAPAQYAAHVRARRAADRRPGYVPALRELCERHDVGAVLPLTDLDIEVLARRAPRGTCRRSCPPPRSRARHMTSTRRTCCSSAWAALAADRAARASLDALDYPVMVKPRRGSGARSIHLARDAAQAAFFSDYVDEPVMVQRLMDGPELSIDCLGDLHGRCLNAIPRTMLESRGGESIKGTVVRRRRADRARPARRWRRSASAARAPSRSFRDPRSASASPTSTRASAAPSRRRCTPRCPGRSYPELIVAMAARRDGRAARRRVPRRA